MTKFAILGAGVFGAALLTTTLAGPARAQAVVEDPGYCAQYYPNANCQNYGPGNPLYRNVSGMIGRAVLPRCIIATTTVSVTVTRGKEGGIDPESWPANWLIPFDLTSLTANKRCRFEAAGIATVLLSVALVARPTIIR